MKKGFAVSESEMIRLCIFLKGEQKVIIPYDIGNNFFLPTPLIPEGTSPFSLEH